MMKKRIITSKEELILLLELGVPVMDGYSPLGIQVPSRDIEFFLRPREADTVNRWIARGDYYVEEE